MDRAIENGIIEEHERFTLHGMKHKGVTDTKGTLQDKQRASGHKSQSMAAHYDHELAEVAPAAE